MPQPDPLSQTFAALSDPTRRAILARLARGTTSVGALAEPFAISLPAISRHLKVLERARLIQRETNAQWRLCRIDPAGLRRAAAWVETYRRFWEDGLDSLARYLDDLNQEKELNDDHGKSTDRDDG